MPSLIGRSVFSAAGWPWEHLGALRMIDGDRCGAGLLPVSDDILPRLRHRTGVHHRVLTLKSDARAMHAA
jgi:N-acyl-L-homoserine lactone synthetase